MSLYEKYGPGSEHWPQSEEEPRPTITTPDLSVWNRPSVVASLVDSEGENTLINMLFGLVNILILLALLALGIALLFMGAAPSDFTDNITKHAGALPWMSRAAFWLGAILTLGTVRIFGKRMENAMRWARLKTSGEIAIDDIGLTIRHDAVLTTGIHLPWNMINVISFDTGINHDSGPHWRRFPVRPSTKNRRYLFATDAGPIEDSTLIASRPTAPNMVIVLNDVITVHNPNVPATDVAFPIEATDGMPSRPPREQSDVWILFLRAANPREMRRILSISGKVRTIRNTDLPGISLDDPNAVSKDRRHAS